MAFKIANFNVGSVKWEVIFTPKAVFKGKYVKAARDMVNHRVIVSERAEDGRHLSDKEIQEIFEVAIVPLFVTHEIEKLKK